MSDNKSDKSKATSEGAKQQNDPIGEEIPMDEKLRLTWKNAFESYDFTFVDKLIEAMDELYEVELDPKKVLEVVKKNVKR